VRPASPTALHEVLSFRPSRGRRFSWVGRIRAHPRVPATPRLGSRVGSALIETHELTKTTGGGPGRARLASGLASRSHRRVSSPSWVLGVGQIHLHEPARLSRRTDLGALCPRHAGRVQPSGDALAKTRNAKIGFVFQGFNLSPHSASRTWSCRFSTRACCRERHERAQAKLWPSAWPIGADHHPSQLSGGQQQRVANRRALVQRSVLILADEPTGNLDTRTSVGSHGHPGKTSNPQGITVVLVTHEGRTCWPFAARHHHVPRRSGAQRRSGDGDGNARQVLTSPAREEDEE